MTVVVLTLSLLIGLIIVILMWLNKYNKNAEEIIIRRLNILSERTDENLLSINSNIDDFMSKINGSVKKEMKRLSDTIKSNLNNNNKAFESFLSEARRSLEKEKKYFQTLTQEIKLGYGKYVEKVDEINENLRVSIEKFNENGRQLNVLTPQVEGNNKALEKVVDKTKELIASYESNMVAHIDHYEETLNNLSAKYHDSITELASSTESILAHAVEDDAKSVEKLHNEITEKYNLLATNSLQKMELLSKEMNQKIEKEFKDSDLDRITILVADFNEHLKQTLKKDKKNYDEIKIYFDEKFSAVDEKLEVATKKRRLF